MNATWEFRMSKCEVSKGDEFPLNKGGKEGEAFWGLSGLVQSTRTDNPQALRAAAFVKGDFVVRHLHFFLTSSFLPAVQPFHPKRLPRPEA